VNRKHRRQLLIDERRDLSSFLASLEPADWHTQSLCTDWRVIEVAAHLSSAIGVSRHGLLARGIRYGTGTRGANARTAAAWTAKGIPHLIASLEDPQRLGFGHFYPGWALCEAVVHHQDMRRPLGRMRTVPFERLRIALDVLARFPFILGPGRQHRGVRLVATDIDWSRGDGPEVRGPAEALLMAVAGRPAVIDELSGEGRGLLAVAREPRPPMS
jgi:uncharacterized protein (TIGR03083 family)